MGLVGQPNIYSLDNTHDKVETKLHNTVSTGCQNWVLTRLKFAKLLTLFSLWKGVQKV